ncbi:MAG: DUF1294 domain-containing protein [Traorella sp.]
MKYLTLYLIIVNFIGFIMICLDKYKAKHHKYRIPEKYFFLLSLIGGSLGTYCAMFIFHHKTKKMKFLFGIPLLLLSNLMIFWYLYTNFIE